MIDARKHASIKPAVLFHVLRFHAGNAWRAYGRDCRTARPCRHTDGRTPLRALGAILYRGRDPRGGAEWHQARPQSGFDRRQAWVLSRRIGIATRHGRHRTGLPPRPQCGCTRAEVRLSDMAKSKRERQSAKSLLAQREHLDALMQAIYGRTFEDYRRTLFRYAYQGGFEDGKRTGFVSGRRAAKGLKGLPKNRGRPLEIEQGLMTLCVWHVYQERKLGKSVKQAICEFLEIMRIGQERASNKSSVTEPRARLPTVKKAMQAYYRDRKKRHLNF